MSYSIGATGPLSAVRTTIAEQTSRSYCTREQRVAAAILNAEIDHLETQGVTHVIASASGHASSFNISVQRDETAESAYKATEAAKAFDAWRESGEKAGHITEGSTPSTAQIHVPTGSKYASLSVPFNTSECGVPINAKAMEQKAGLTTEASTPTRKS